MQKIHLLFLLIFFAAFHFTYPNLYAQQVQKKHVVKKKAVVKDTLPDSSAIADSVNTPKQEVKAKTTKQKTKKKPVIKEVVKDTVDQADTVNILKDTVKVTFGRNLVNLRTFNGWIVDERGKWVHSPNRIPFRNPDYNNELYTKYKIGAENIKQINIDEVKIDSTPYLAIIIEEYKGHYRDKKDSDYRIFVGADYYLIKPEDYQDLWNDTFKMKHPYQANLRVYYSGLVGYRDVRLRPKYMSMEINKDIRNSIYTDTTVKTWLQFGMIPHQANKERTMRFYYNLTYAKTGKPVQAFDFSVFKERFYEADLELFHKFCRPKSIIVNKKHKPVTSPAPTTPPPAILRDDRPVED